MCFIFLVLKKGLQNKIHAFRLSYKGLKKLLEYLKTAKIKYVKTHIHVNFFYF